MRFVVVGAGAVGGVVGGRLAQHDHDVVLVARGDHGQAIAADGLLIRSPDDEVRVPVPVVSHPSELTLTDDDVVLLAVKGQDTRGGARGPGRRSARPGDRLPPERRGQRAPGAAAHAEHLRGAGDAPGHLPRARRGRGVVGADHRDPRRRPLPDAASTSGPRRSPPRSPRRRSARIPQPDVMRFKWSKLLMNLGNALEAAVGPDRSRERAVRDGRAPRRRRCSTRPASTTPRWRRTPSAAAT